MVINKWDVLQRVGVFKCIHNGSIVEFKDAGEMKTYLIRELATGAIPELHDVRFSDSPETI